MRAANIYKILRNDIDQYRCNKRSLISNFIGSAFLLLLLILVIVFPLMTINDLDIELINSIRLRHADIDNETLVRIAVSETIIPGLLLLPAIMSPVLLALSTLTAEKEKRTLECLLLLPVTDKEILVSKILSSILIAIFGTWIAYLTSGIFALFYHPPVYASYYFSGKLLVEVLFLVPSIAVLSALGGIIVSINVSDSRTAQSMSFIPQAILSSVGFMLILGTLVLSPGFLFIAAILINLLNVIGLGIAVSFFKREKMLLRY